MRSSQKRKWLFEVSAEFIYCINTSTFGISIRKPNHFHLWKHVCRFLFANMDRYHCYQSGFTHFIYIPSDKGRFIAKNICWTFTMLRYDAKNFLQRTLYHLLRTWKRFNYEVELFRYAFCINVSFFLNSCFDWIKQSFFRCILHLTNGRFYQFISIIKKKINDADFQLIRLHTEYH